MRNGILSLALATLSLLTVGVQTAKAQRSQTAKKATFVEGKIRVKLQSDIASKVTSVVLPSGVAKTKGAAYVKTGFTPFDRVSQQVTAVKMTRVFPYAGKDEARHKKEGLDRWYDISYEAKDMSLQQVKNLYKAVPGVEHAQRVVAYQVDGNPTYRVATQEELARAAARASVTLPFNDPLLSSQWHFYNDGSLAGSLAGADINVFPAWNNGYTGSKDVVVAIIDGGFQIDHPDLKDNLWINEAELNGKAGVDDDGDGYVDDIYGYNFVVNSANITSHQHGTHVAGIVGATNNNGIGVSGVAGGSDGTGGVKMMVCQVFDSNASESVDANYAGALVYAADRGASIAQCSWGSAEADNEDVAISEAVRYFTKYGGGDKMNGGLCIFATGNTSSEGRFYPGCLDEVVAVAASTPMGTAATYSSYGTWVDVTAPGGYSEAGEKYEILSTLPNSSYGYLEGTSMACPHVSGVAALILSKYGNKNFSNETLRTLLTSSVNRLYYTDEEYVGKFGSGVIDAYKALQGSETSVPSAVADLTVIASHNYVTLQWTIPESDEKSVDHHVVYYSKSPITAETDLSTLDRKSIDTKYYNCGDRMEDELDGLEAMTTYYFTIVAYNRWGKSSAMSPVVEATTNEGPTAKLNTDALSMAIDATKSASATVRFRVQNTGKGILKYSFTTGTQSAVMSASSTGANPAPGRIAPFAGKVSSESSSTATYPVVTADYQVADYPDTLRYSKSLKAYIGENDTELPNAMAQYFYVDPAKFPNGFNLTDLYFQGQYGKDPVLEIYDGSRSISTATLLTTVGYTDWAYNQYLPLEEQQFFAPGKSFWVVAKFPAGVQRPLAVGTANTSGIQNYSFYSSDNGETWTQLSEVLKGSSFESTADQLTWAVYAVSKNPNWSSVLSTDPKEGEVEAGKTQTVKLSNDGQPLVNGTYKMKLHLKTNEATATDNAIAVTMTVSGYKPSVTSKQLIDFGSLLVGQESTYSIEIANTGYGAFATKGGSFYTYNGTMACTSDQFQLDQVLKSIAARSSRNLNVTFKPTKAGNFSGTVTLTDKNGLKHSFTVCGTAIDPAKLNVAQTDFDLGDLEVGGEAKTAVISITNEGKYPLQYVFPKFSDKSIEGSAKGHRYGYTYQTNVDGANDIAYEGVPELDDEVDITSQFGDLSWQSGAVPLGFKFPFYGKDYQEVYINSRGAVQMERCQTVTIGAFVPDPASVKGLGYISGYANNGYGGNMDMLPNSKVSYGHKDGKFYVVYKDVQVQGIDGTYTTMSMHMVLDAQGNTTIYYDDYDPAAMRDSGILNYIGICDIESADPMSVTYADIARAGNTFYSKLATGSVVKIVAPGKFMVTGVSSADGYVGIGETKEVTLTAKANENLFAGELTNHIIMHTNDPKASSKVFNITANITGDKFVADAVIDSAKIDFGKVFRTSDQHRTMRVLNNGTKAVEVTAITLKSGAVNIADDLKAGFTVKPNESKDVRVALPTATSGAVSDVITVTYADATTAEVPVTAEVIGVPVAAVTPAEASFTTPYGTDVATSFTIANNGDEPMTASTKADFWYGLSNAVDDSQSTIRYVYKTSQDYQDVKYDWIDILNDYDEHCNLAYYYNKTDYKEVDLPFEFPFYGKKYTKMYLYDSGFMQFSKPKEDYKMFPEPPVTLPDGETFYRNIIAPLWGNHTMNTGTVDGIYYKKFDDHAVVTFKNYGNSVMSGFNFQCVLYPDGTYKFMYQLDEDGMLNGIYGLAGAQDENAKRGFVVSSMYINPGVAIEVQPEFDYVIAPGSSVDLGVTVKADKLADTYENLLTLTTNDPNSQKVEIPVVLTTTGEALPVVPESLSVKQVYDTEYMQPAQIDFTVGNNGHKAFTITNISADMLEPDDNYSYNAQLMVYRSGGSDDDPNPGPLAADASGSYSWTTYWPGQSEPIVVGDEPVKMRLLYLNVASPVTVNDKLKFDIEGMEPLTADVSVMITDAPKMTFSSDSIVINNVDRDYTGSQTVTIANNGKYQLDYTLTLDPAGNDVSIDDELGGDNDWGIGGLSAPLVSSKVIAESDSLKSLFRQHVFDFADTKGFKRMAKARKSDAYVWDDPVAGGSSTPDAPEHTNALYHPIMQPISSAKVAVMGVGSENTDENFYAATRYTAPAEGFNLTHVFFVGTVGPLQNVDVEGSVVLGDNVAATKNVVATGKLRIESDEPTNGGYYGTPRTLKFDNPVYINPGESFYIVLKYPAGYMGNALMVSKDGDLVDNRYMAYLEDMGGWIDIESAINSSYGYGAFGYFMTALEEQPGKPWIQLSADTKTENTIEVGQTADVKIDLTAASAYYDHGNKATLVVRSNDPQKRVYNYHVYLNRNGAPTVTAPKSTTTVAQGATATVKLSVADTEGDAFTVSVADEANVASIETVANGDGTQDGVSLSDDGVVSVEAGKSLTLGVKLAPDYDVPAGLTTFTVTATDQNGNSAQADVTYSVEATNRAPVYTGSEDYTLGVGSLSAEYSWTSLFTDPEGDDMTYNAYVLNPEAAVLYKSDNGFVIAAKKVADTELAIAATDSNGSTTTVRKPLKIVSATGIGGVEADNGSLTVDADGAKVVVTVGEHMANATFYLYDAAGKLLGKLHAENIAAGRSLNFNTGSLQQGVYTVLVSSDGKTQVAKFAVK